MTLAVGTKLGPYEILSTIGVGGMGEVYRAKDTRLGREVALKILPPEVADDSSRRQRFEQEARAIAALSHPNILAIYDVGQESGSTFMVTELVDGGSLRGAQFATRKALDIAAQIASGLAAAHDAGVVHRDLKPDNILLTRDGRVKILDFGLAKLKAMRSDSATAETWSMVTSPGVVMGTVGYMSPEQVRGDSVDYRSDIFSFGLVLYELLAATPAFQGATSVETMSAILTQDPPELPETIPAGARQIVFHCLEKDPANRFQSSHDLGFALAQCTTRTGALAPIAPRRNALRASVVVMLCCAVAAVAVAIFLSRAPVSPKNWTSASLGGPEVAWGPRVSPDGRTVAMLTMVDDQAQVAIMRPDAGDWTLLTHDKNIVFIDALSWSHDGDYIYFDSYPEVPKGIFRVPVLGGEPHLILDDAACPEALPDGSLLAAQLNSAGQQQVCRYWPESGRLQRYPVELTGGGSGVPLIRALPGGREAVLFGRLIPQGSGSSGSRLYVLDLVSGKVQSLPTPPGVGTATLAVTHDGKDVLGFSYTVSWSAALNRSGTLRPWMPLSSNVWGADTGADGSVYLDQIYRPGEMVLLDGGHAIRAGPVLQTQANAFSLLPDGRAVWQQEIGGKPRLIAVAPGKPPEPLIQTAEMTYLPATPAGPGLLAFLVGPPSKPEIGIASLATGHIVRRIQFSEGPPEGLTASPDGKALYTVAHHAVWSIPTVGGAPTRLHEGDGVAVAPNGRFVVIMNPNKHIYRVPLDGTPEHEVPIASDLHPVWFGGPQAIAPDGRMLTCFVSPTSWFVLPGIIDLETGRVTRIPTDLHADHMCLNWTADGKVMAIAYRFHASIWKFTPEGQ